jgi:hypothetical protein
MILVHIIIKYNVSYFYIEEVFPLNYFIPILILINILTNKNYVLIML